MTGPSNPRREHAGTNPSAPTRHTVDTLNSDALDALYDEIDRLRAKVAEFDHIISWHTTCASCARILDSAYQETVRAEQAEAAVARVSAECDRIEAAVHANPQDPDFDGAYLAAIKHIRTALDEPKED